MIMSTKKETKEIEPIIVSAVLYTDGSANPNPGYGGWGIHGYTYDSSKPIELKAQKKNLITQYGYKDLKFVQRDDLSVYKKIDEFKERNHYSFFISIGNNAYRLEKYLKLEKYQCDIVNVVDKTAIVSSHSVLGKGVFVGKMAIVNSGVTVGDNVIINTKSLVEHGCIIGSHSNLSTNSTLNGDVIVENYCFVGSSSVITGQLRIGESSIIGAGAVVIRNVKPRTVVAGVPAKLIKEVE